MRQIWLIGLAALMGCGGNAEVGSGGSGGAAGSAGSGGAAGTAGSGGGTGGTGGTTVGTAIWPSDSVRLHATSSGGGEFFSPPPGSDCTIGAAEYALDVASRNLTWTECRCEDTCEGPWLETTGSRTLTETEYAAVDAAMLGLTVYAGDACGADKALLVIEVTDPKGTLAYYDSFYSCYWDDRVYVEDIDPVFAALRALSSTPQ